MNQKIKHPVIRVHECVVQRALAMEVFEERKQLLRLVKVRCADFEENLLQGFQAATTVLVKQALVVITYHWIDNSIHLQKRNFNIVVRQSFTD